MANKLSDWLPLLTHPEVGERIVEAAGVDVEVWGVLFRFAGVDVPVYADEEPPQWALAALAFGTLEVLADNGFTSTIERYGLHFGNGELEDEPTLTAAVLAAARRVWLLANTGKVLESPQAVSCAHEIGHNAYSRRAQDGTGG